MDKESHPIKGIFICLLAYFFVSVVGVYRKFLSADVSIFDILFFQNAIGLLLLIPGTIKNKITPIARAHFGSYIVRIVSGLACYLLLFYILNYMPISQAFLFQYSASLWIPFIAWIWLQARITRDTWYGIIIGFVGICMIIKPINLFHNAVCLLGVFCGILQGISVVAIRKLSKTETTLSMLFYYFLVGMLVSAPFTLKHLPFISLHNIILLSLIGVNTYLAQKLVTVSLRFANATTLAPICYTSLLFSGVIAFVLWKELPDKLSFIGMLFVICGCVATIITSKIREARTMLVFE